MNSELRKELGYFWPLWMVLYGIVCGAGGAALVLLVLAFAINDNLP